MEGVIENLSVGIFLMFLFILLAIWLIGKCVNHVEPKNEEWNESADEHLEELRTLSESEIRQKRDQEEFKNDFEVIDEEPLKEGTTL